MNLDMRVEFDGLELGDCRRGRRVKRIIKSLSARPDRGFPQAFASRADTEAFYRLVESEDVTFDALFKPHQRATASRCEDHSIVLVAHDTTDFRYKGDGRNGLGKVSTSTDKAQGFYGHFSLAVSADGRREPLGVLAVQRWARTAPGVSTRRRSGELTYAEGRQLPRESARWGNGVRQVEAVLAETGAAPIHIMDSEADDFALFCQLTGSSERFVIRGYQTRMLADPTVARTIKEFVTMLPIAFEVYADISKRKVKMFDDRKRQQKRETRTAQLVFHAGIVRLKRPTLAEKELPNELELNVVHVREVGAPEGQEPVDWTLFTTESIDTDDQISRIVDYYRARWVIEEFFKALKTGCAFEKRQLESMHTLENALALFLPIAWGLLRLRTLARHYPDVPAASALEPLEITVLQRMKLVSAHATPTLGEALLAVAKLGGFLKNNGEPGWLVLGRGYQELIAMAAGFRLALQNWDQS
jgi:hypothetical protein